MSKIGEKIWKFLVVIQFCTISPASHGPPLKNYCFLRCPGAISEAHSVCKRSHKCGPVQNCTEILPDENFRRHILHQHNEIRNGIANGSDKGSYGNTGATNMNALSYDMELEYIAACSTNTCRQTKIDFCNDSERFMVSINRIWGRKDNWTAKAVPEFYKRIRYVTNAKQIREYSPVPAKQKYRESFLRLVWAETKYLGCSRATEGTNTKETMLKCLYGPAKYIKGRPVYKMATKSNEIASECQKGRNTQYTSLCGEIDPIPKGKMWTVYSYD